ncbi:MAG: hypothetical protein ACXVCP_00335 [Bdellovibrio sp.]
MARPQIKVDEVLLEKLAKLHLSDKVIADVVGVSIDTLNRRFAEKIEIWKSESKSKIAHVLFDEAVNKREPWALKALSQRHLGYADKVEQKQEHTFATLSDEELDAKLDKFTKK